MPKISIIHPTELVTENRNKEQTSLVSRKKTQLKTQTGQANKENSELIPYKKRGMPLPEQASEVDFNRNIWSRAKVYTITKAHKTPETEPGPLLHLPKVRKL